MSFNNDNIGKILPDKDVKYLNVQRSNKTLNTQNFLFKQFDLSLLECLWENKPSILGIMTDLSETVLIERMN